MSHSMLRKIRKFDIDLRPHKMVLSNYEGNTGAVLGIIQVDVMVETIVRSTSFVVISTKANYNLLLDREWIHDVVSGEPFALEKDIFHSINYIQLMNSFRNMKLWEKV